MRLEPGADPRTGARALRDAWVWAALPSNARRVGAHGGSLPLTLRAAGFEVVDPRDPDLDAIALDTGEQDASSEFWTRGDVPLVAMAVAGGRDTVRERIRRPARAAQLAWETLSATSIRRRSRQIMRTAKASGRLVSVVATSDRSRPYVLGDGGFRRPQAGSIVTGWTGTPEASPYDEAVAAARAGDHADVALEAEIVESGKLICRVRGPDDAPRAVVRVAGGTAGDLIARAAAAVATLGDPGVPESVRRVLPRAVATGRAGLATFTVEAWVPGDGPVKLDESLWHSCCEFLEGLRAIPVGPAPDVEGILEEDREVLAGVLPEDARRRLDRVGRRLAAELAGVPLGWAHGDFWPDNLVVRDGRIAAVLDWDTASAHELPGLDALDLIGFAAPHGRWVTFGPRLVNSILPLASAQDARLVAHCRAVGAPSDRTGLEALAWAWWLRRTALTVREYPDRRSRPAWLRENLLQPLLSAPSESSVSHARAA